MLLFWWNTDFDEDSELEGAILITFGSFRRYPAGLCFLSSEEVAQLTMSARLPCHSFAQQSQTHCSVPRIRPFTHACILVSCLTDFTLCDYWSWFFLERQDRSTDCHSHSEMVRLLRLTLFSTHIWLWFLDIRPVAQSEA